MAPKRKKQKGEGGCPEECQEVLTFLLTKPEITAYAEPVDWQLYGLDDYPKIIKTPMDLGTVQTKFDGGSYASVEEFESDVNLVFSNAMVYNRPDSDIYKTAEKLLKLFEKRLQKVKKTEQAKKGGPSSAKKEKRSEVTKADRLKFCQLVHQLVASELEELVDKIERDCPQALTEEEEDELEISINNIDPSSLLSLNDFCNKCIAARKESS